MRDVLVTWELPAPNPFGSDLEAVEIAISANGGADFTPLPDVGVGETQEQFFQQLDFGDWIIRLVVRDVDGRLSSGVQTPFRVPDESPPGDVLNVQVQLQ